MRPLQGIVSDFRGEMATRAVRKSDESGCGEDSAAGGVQQLARVCRGVTFAEDRIAGDEQVRTGFNDGGDSFEIDAAVDFNVEVEAELFTDLGELANLVEREGNEFLAAEAGVHAHDEDVVNHGQNVTQQQDRRGGIEDDAGLHVVIGDVGEGAVEVGAGLVMDADPIRAGFGEGRDEVVGILDHQVAIEWKLRRFAQRFDDRWAEGDVGHKVAVHDVDVDDGAAAFFGRRDGVGQVSEVRGENRRSQLRREGRSHG